MSKRAPNPAAERAAQNQQTIKSLLKLEANKVCADCKRNKHPRWASWNLGVFICIRCSGIHRGMGTHISRVKSVDLDSWTDEQLQSILSWGNARANKYWESKLAPGHVPSEAKIENFIRTKYELKRWVMDGPMPDPSTLDADADDDIPLSIVKEKQTIDRKESIRKASIGKNGAPVAAAAAAASAASSASIDLIGHEPSAPALPRASTVNPTASRVPPKAEPAPPKATTSSSTNSSLLGLDFLGSRPSAPARPATTTGLPPSGGQSRPDLKQSILSLYATAPRVQQQQQQQQQQGQSQSQSSSGFVDAFSNLSFASAPPTARSTPKPVDAFSGLSSFSSTNTRSAAPSVSASSSSAFGTLGSGSFFDAKPTSPAASTTTAALPSSSSSAALSSLGGLGSLGGDGGFGGFTSSPSPPAAKPAAASSNAFGELFDLTAPAPTTTSPPPHTTSTPTMSPPPGASASMNSVFNLSSPTHQPAQPAAMPASVPAPAPAPTSPLANVSANWSNADVWGDNAWSSSSAAPTPAPAAAAATTLSTSSFQTTSLAKATTTNDFGWGSSSTGAGTGSTSTGGGAFASQSIVPGMSGGFAPAPQVTADEEFGGWSSSAPVANTSSSSSAAKPAGSFGANEDLFSNVWS